VLVVLAETPEYYQSQESITGRGVFYKEVEDEISKFSNTYFLKQSQVPVIDSHDPSLFSDGGYGVANSHLSYKGGQIYSKYLAEFVRKKMK